MLGRELGSQKRPYLILKTSECQDIQISPFPWKGNSPRAADLRARWSSSRKLASRNRGPGLPTEPSLAQPRPGLNSIS